jgi:hypothetical protein
MLRPMNRIKDPYINPYNYGRLFFALGPKTYVGVKIASFTHLGRKTET